MTLKELLEKDFVNELNISGGTGNSIDNAIIIHRNRINDYVRTEYYILKCIGIGRRIEWKTIGQELLFYNDKKIDKIKIETTNFSNNEITKQIESFYFDITECYGK